MFYSFIGITIICDLFEVIVDKLNMSDDAAAILAINAPESTQLFTANFGEASQIHTLIFYKLIQHFVIIYFVYVQTP